ncbi:hypothetical protein IW262DRAFT_126719 [Armillaria fumosa]|nr:hypothetical protein IW262DRAFT_126719 [Armillaria fumosa]
MELTGATNPKELTTNATYMETIYSKTIDAPSKEEVLVGDGIIVEKCLIKSSNSVARSHGREIRTQWALAAGNKLVQCRRRNTKTELCSRVTRMKSSPGYGNRSRNGARRTRPRLFQVLFIDELTPLVVMPLMGQLRSASFHSPHGLLFNLRQHCTAKIRSSKSYNAVTSRECRPYSGRYECPYIHSHANDTAAFGHPDFMCADTGLEAKGRSSGRGGFEADVYVFYG